MTTVTLGRPATAAKLLAALPSSLELSRPALGLLADGCGADGSGADGCGITLPWSRPDTSGAHRLADALGGGRARPPDSGDPGRELIAAGAVRPDGRPEPALAAALRAFSTPDVVVDLDLSVRRPSAPRGFAQLHAWHRLTGDQVSTLTCAGGDQVELGWFGAAWWQPVLARLVPEPPPGSDEPAPRPGLTLPLPLWLGSGEALRTGRADLLAQLLEQHRGHVLDAAEVPLDAAESDHQVRLVHGCVGARLRAVVSAPAAARRLGMISWLRYADGWRALTPVVRQGGGPAVRLDPVTPLRLGAEIARLAAGVRR